MTIRDKLGRFLPGLPKECSLRFTNQASRIRINCAYCNEGIRIKPSYYKVSKRKIFYCCRDHQKLSNFVKIKCIVCGEERIIHPSDKKIKRRGLYCSKACRGRAQLPLGENNIFWKGGIIKDGNGYIRRRVNGKYIMEHRLIMGVEDNPLVVVHHRNGNPSDNRPENLLILSPQEHSVLENNVRWGNVKREIT